MRDDTLGTSAKRRSSFEHVTNLSNHNNVC